ncbi:MAG TPA: RnfABCDGE type electron transport complex subunit D [Planctomycetota bacterium]|nr:RnfABCDGE type electron transport complex subunit D [Planctomycetota bacterium]
MRAGPFIHGRCTTRGLMVQVLLALSPVVLAALWRHGWSAAALFGAALAGSWLTDVLCDRKNALDGSAAVTGLIFACLLPLSAPWWIAAAGGAIAIGLGKHLFGGLGQNPFNPSALSRAILMGIIPATFFAPGWEFDGVTLATPLAKEIDSMSPSLGDLALGQYPGTLAEAFPLAILAGGLLLVALRTIDWRIPLSHLAAISILAMILPSGARLAGHAPWLAGNPLVHLLAGGVLLSAFFMLTDPVTAPFTAKGRVAFAILAAFYTMIVRFYTPYPDGAILAILLANASVPLIDGASFRHWPRWDSAGERGA